MPTSSDTFLSRWESGTSPAVHTLQTRQALLRTSGSSSGWSVALQLGGCTGEAGWGVEDESMSWLVTLNLKRCESQKAPHFS